MTTVLFPGSFDPPHEGHIDVIDRSLAQFDRVVVAIVENPAKNALFTEAERVELFDQIYGDQIEVTSFRGLLVDFAADVGADLVIKGLRNADDFEYEAQMAQMNRHLTRMETMFVVTRADLGFVSSSLVKEVARLGGSVSGLVPDVVEKALKEKLQ